MGPSIRDKRYRRGWMQSSMVYLAQKAGHCFAAGFQRILLLGSRSDPLPGRKVKESAGLCAMLQAYMPRHDSMVSRV